MQFKFVPLIAICWGVVLAAPNPNDATLNALIDSILNKFDQAVVSSGLEPADLPDVGIEFSKKILLVTWRGAAKAYNGTLSGLSSAHRSADAQYVKSEEGRVIGFTTSMSMNVMEGGYEYVAQFMDIGPKGDVSMTIEGITLSFSAALDEHLCVFSLDQFNIDNIGHISIEIHGLGPLNWIANMFSSAIANVVKVFLKEILEWQFKGILNNVLDDYDLYKYRWLPWIHCDKRPRDVMPAMIPRY